MPIVGVLAHSENLDDGKLYAVRATYVSAISRHGGLPVIAPPFEDEFAAEEFADFIDGLLVPGGVDIDPSLYGEQPHPGLGRVDHDLDQAEMQLIREAFRRDLPILGICRGIQSLVVALSGDLYQDLPSQRDGLRHEAREHGRAFLSHDMSVRPGSRLHEVLGRDTIGVNSLHHQGVRTLPEDLEPSGWSPDGLVEAVEAPSRRFVVAVQCHPEELWSQTEPAFSRLFARFVDAASTVSESVTPAFS